MQAQKTSGSITGQVTDPSGAVVPSAAVTLLNKSTGINRTATTNDQGDYTFDDVQIGTYEVDVTATGFRQFATKGVIVNVATASRADAHLVTGNVNEVVTVSADAVQVQTDSGSLGNVVDGTQVKELPLNGRSFVQLTQLGPGVSAANNFDSKNKGLQGGVDFSVNGNPTTNNLFLVDGANDNDVGSNRTILIYPSVESIAEFKMLTNSYGPEYGQASGAIVTIATRSGTNSFHGSAFYSGRNDALASYTYFARRNANPSLPQGGKDKLRRNDWGYSIGGPIKKDKLFFFFNEEWNHEIRSFTQQACVPTAAERAGDFSAAVGTVNGTAVMSCNEPQPTFPVALRLNGNPHALNTVDPTGSLLPQYLTLPNKTPSELGGNNWSQSLSTFLKYRQENVRADYNLNSKNVVMGRYTQDSWSNPAYNGNQYWGDTPFPTINSSWAQPSKMVIGRWTSTISNTLVNDAEFSYSNNRINITPGGTDVGLIAQLNAAVPSLYPTSFKNNKAGTIPFVNGGLGGYGAQGSNIWTIAPWNNTLDIYAIRDDLSKVLGNHAMKFGFSYTWNGKNEDTGPSVSERPTFGTGDGSVNVDPTAGLVGTRTANNLANVLIPGNPFLINETSTNIRAQLRWNDLGIYASDTWKLTPKLTLNYGVRYAQLRSPHQPQSQMTSFQPFLYDPSLPASDACNGLWIVKGKTPCADANARFGTKFTEGTPGPGNNLVYNANHLFMPRVGISYDVFGDGKTAVRAGFGQFFQRERVSRYTLVSNAPFAVTTNNYVRTLGGATPASLTGGSASPSGGFDPRAVLPNSLQWNLTVEQTLARNTVLQVSYVGNRGIHLTSNYDVNGIAPQNWLAASFLNGDQQGALRPYSNYHQTLAYWSQGGDSYYHSLQTFLRTQVAGFRFQAAYTWSHSIADVLSDNSDGGTSVGSFTYGATPRFDRGNAATNRPNLFVANGTYLLPKLQGHSQLAQQTLGGWELTGITTADSGNSFSIYQGGVSENTNAIIGGPQTPGAGNLNSLFQTGLTAGERPLFTNPTAGCQSGSSSDRSQIINPNSFTLVGYHIGTIEPNTAPRGACHGPRLINTDFSIDKNWRVKERFTVQFRFDAFDLLNHANFRADQGNFGLVTNVNCGPALNGLYNPCSPSNNVISTETPGSNFGHSTAVVGNAERQFQYGLHIEF